MSEKINFKTLRPKLKECHIYQGERNLVLEEKISQAQVVLPKSHQSIIELFNGKHTLKEMVTILYTKEGHVSFNSLITTLRLLQDAHLLEGQENLFENIHDEKSPHEQKASLLIRAFFEKRLINKIKIPFTSDILYYVLAGIIIAFVATKTHSHVFQFHLARFLKTSTGYNEAFPRLIIMSSFLLTMKALFQSILLLVSTGSFYGPYFRVNLYAIYFGINDNSIYSHPKKDVIISYSVISASLFLFTTIIFSQIFPQSTYLNDLKILSILLTFIELNPYRKSDLTKIFHFFYAEEQLKSIMPYLKNCSLSGIIEDTQAKISDEIRYVIYSILAFSWAIGFSLFSIDILMKSFPSLFFQIQLGSMVSKVSAMGLSAMFMALFAYLFMDLSQTLIKNIVSPLFVPLMKFKRKSKDYVSPDISIDTIKKNLSQHMLFNQLNEKTINYLLNNSKLKKVSKGTHLILQGDDSRDVYFIVQGEVDVNVRENTGRTKHIVKMGPNTVIGEMAILNKTKRTANVTAREEVIYLNFPEGLFEDLLQKEEFKSDMDKLKKRIEISQFVSSANLFKDFPPEVMNLFVEAGDLVMFPTGHNIVDEGEQDKTFYLLIKGKVEIQKNNETITELGQGDFFGEVALIANVPRTASVRTTEESLFLFIEDKAFWNILCENIELAMYIESVGRSRMEDAA